MRARSRPPLLSRRRDAHAEVLGLALEDRNVGRARRARVLERVGRDGLPVLAKNAGEKVLELHLATRRRVLAGPECVAAEPHVALVGAGCGASSRTDVGGPQMASL